VKAPGHAVRLVTAALRGRLPHAADWPVVLETANHGWLGPALHLALERADQIDEIPTPVRDYLSLLHERNRARNQRLRAQLIEATRALNAAAIEPILLKGAIHLFSAGDDQLGSRMISDLDIALAPGEVAAARAALAALGYQGADVDREMARPDDVGVIELHDRPSLRSARYLSQDLAACSPAATRDGAVARIPPATARALHLIVHDMIKEGDYWSLRIDLRHLHDLAGLARPGGGLDWQCLAAMLPDPVGRKALVMQARALEDLFGISIPPDLRPRRAAELRHVARLACAGRGPVASVVRLAGTVSRGIHHLADGYVWRGGRKFGRQVYRRLASRGIGSRV
jgi:hypothetical protein